MSMQNFCFRPEQRLHTSAEFQPIFRQRCSVANAQMILYGLRNQQDRTRLGLSVSRKVGNAVVRNRWKRLLREAFRLQQHQLPAGLDLVVVPRAGARPDLEGLRQSFLELSPQLARRLQRHRR